MSENDGTVPPENMNGQDPHDKIVERDEIIVDINARLTKAEAELAEERAREAEPAPSSGQTINTGMLLALLVMAGLLGKTMLFPSAPQPAAPDAIGIETPEAGPVSGPTVDPFAPGNEDTDDELMGGCSSWWPTGNTCDGGAGCEFERYCPGAGTQTTCFIGSGNCPNSLDPADTAAQSWAAANDFSWSSTVSDWVDDDTSEELQDILTDLWENQ